MRTLLLLFIVGAAQTTAAFAEDAARRIDLTVTGAKPRQGQVLVSLFDSPADFLVAPLLQVTAAVDTDGSASVSLNGLDNGDYAIVEIYDENGNGKLDTGLFRIPKEKVGFSNNVYGPFGPAQWQDARFSLTDDDINISIQLTRAKD